LATLNNKKIKDTFKGLLKTLDNAEITGQVEITDGDGNQTGVFINTDGSIKVTGTAEFGSLKDTGEDITITKFVDEADGISNNDDDSSIPTSAAVKDYVDSGVNTNAANISTNTSNISTNTSDISTNTSAIALNTAKNSYPSADAAKVANISVTQAVDLDTLESNVATNNSKVSFDSASSSKLAGIEANAQVNDVTSVNGQTGSVTLTSSNVNEGTNLYYTDSRVASNSAVAANTAKTGITDQQASAINANTSKVGITTQQADAIVANTAKISFDSDSSTKLSGIEANADVTDSTNVTSSLVSATSISETDKSAIRTNIGAGTGAGAVDSVNTQTGDVVLDTDDISEGTSNLYYTDTRVSANSSVAANTAKVGITTQQASDITTNNAKVGITTDQANAITANTAKNSYPSADATKLAGIEAGAEVNPTSTDGLSEGTTNLYYTEARVSANTNVAANTAKVGITTDQANAITANTAKVGITTQQANDITTNNAKVGITTQQANDITTNNAKISFDSTSSTKLAGIEAGAEVNPTASEIKTSYESNANTNAFTDAEQTKLSGIATGAEVNTVDSVNGQTGAVSLSTTNVSEGTNLYYTDARVTANSSVAANTAKISYNATDSTKVGYISITQAVDLDVVENKQENQYKIIGVAMDYSNRVLSDSGTAEGTQSIMENIETLILN
jgi:Cu/Ag efflux protein CusF